MMRLQDITDQKFGWIFSVLYIWTSSKSNCLFVTWQTGQEPLPHWGFVLCSLLPFLDGVVVSLSYRHRAYSPPTSGLSLQPSTARWWDFLSVISPHAALQRLSWKHHHLQGVPPHPGHACLHQPGGRRTWNRYLCMAVASCQTIHF